MNANFVALQNELTPKEEPANAPFFSVVIPAHNAAPHIADALNSVFAQTVDDYEIIVINDGSPDTEELELGIQPYLDKLTYISRLNGGPAAARNTGILCATGEYIAFLDSDDRWVPDHLAMSMKVLKKNPTVDLVYGDALNFGDVSEPGRTTMEGNPSEGVATFESLVLGKCTVIGSTVVARRQALIDTGLFDENFVHGEDFDLWARMAYRGGRIDYQHRIHTHRRIHKGNLTADAISSFKGTAEVLRKFMNELELPSTLKSQMHDEMEKCYAAIALEKCKQGIVNERYQEAVVELQRANASYRSPKLQLVLYLLRTVPRLVRRMYLKQRIKHNGMNLRSDFPLIQFWFSVLTISLKTCVVLLDS